MLIENLETRRMMSVSLNASTHVLTITGTDNPDAITVKVVNGLLNVKDNGASKTFALPAVQKLAIFARAGADQVTLDQNVLVPSVIDSGTGHPAGGPGDVIQGGGGKDTIHLRADFAKARGGNNSDAIYNYGGFNSVRGEAGNDILSSKRTSVSDSSYDGGSGTDTIDYSAASSGLVIRNGQSGVYAEGTGIPPVVLGFAVDGVAGFENFYGGKGNDFIFGNGANNLIRGNGGNDYIRGGGGNDTLVGGAGEDAMFGDDGNDVFYSKDGVKDFLSGGAGYDKANLDFVDILNSVEASF